MFCITFSACKTVSSSDETVTTEETDTEIAVSVASDSVVSKETVSPKTDDTTVSVKPSKSKKESEEPTSYVEVYPDTSELPTEIMQVFYEDKPFNFVFYEFRKCGDGFVNYRNSMSVCVKDFVYNLSKSELKDGSLDDNEYTVYWKEYTVIDLDDDGVNELVYLVDPGSGGYIIFFHVIDGEVYGYSEFLRDMEVLYKDRVIMGESGAAWYRYKRIISFNKEGYTIEELARAEQPHAEELYYIGDEEVDEATFRDYTAQWGDKYCEMAVKWISANSD